MTGEELIAKYRALLDEAAHVEVTPEEFEILAELGAPVQFVEEKEKEEAPAQS